MIHPFFAAVLLLSFSTCGATAVAEIFRTVDADGNVVFSDTPPAPAAQRPDERVEAVELPEANTFEPPPREFELRDLEIPDAEQPATVSYSKVRIVSPTDDEVIRNNAGSVTVITAAEPELAPGHTLQLILDGELVEANTSGSFELSYVDRGTHKLIARVVDAQTGEEFMRSAPSTFHLQRYFKRPSGN